MKALQVFFYVVGSLAAMMYIAKNVATLLVASAMSKVKKLAVEFDVQLEAIRMSVTPRVDVWWNEVGKQKAIAYADGHPMSGFASMIFGDDDPDNNPIVAELYSHVLGLAIHTAAEEAFQKRIAKVRKFVPKSTVTDRLNESFQSHTNEHRIALVDARFNIEEIEALGQPA